MKSAQLCYQIYIVDIQYDMTFTMSAYGQLWELLCLSTRSVLLENDWLPHEGVYHIPKFTGCISHFHQTPNPQNMSLFDGKTFARIIQLAVVEGLYTHRLGTQNGKFERPYLYLLP